MTVEATRKKHMKKPLLELFAYAESAVLDGQIVMPGATEGTIVPCTANADPLGICLRTVTTAQITLVDDEEAGMDSIKCPVAIIGIAPVLAGGEVDFNEWVVSDANGRVVAATGDGTDNIIGICLNETTADGENTHIQIHRIPATSQA